MCTISLLRASEIAFTFGVLVAKKGGAGARYIADLRWWGRDDVGGADGITGQAGQGPCRRTRVCIRWWHAGIERYAVRGYALVCACVARA